MELLRLKIFLDVAREKSFSKAALLNHLSQPAISAHIRHLEEELQTSLLRRSPQEVALTEAGEMLIPLAEEIVLKSHQIKDLFLRSSLLPHPIIRIAAIPTVGIYELPTLWKGFLKIHPHLHIDLRHLAAEEIYPLLLKEQIDFGIVACAQKRKGIKAIPFRSEEMVTIVAPSHPLAGEKEISLSRIQGERFVGFEETTPTQQHINSFLRKKRIKLSFVAQHSHIDTLKKAVEIGIGISIVPLYAVQEEISRKTLCALKINNKEIVRTTSLLVLEKRPLNRFSESFLRHVCNHFSASTATK